MEFDLAYAVNILDKVAQAPTPKVDMTCVPDLEQWYETWEKYQYHIEKLEEAGFLRWERGPRIMPTGAQYGELTPTYDGHEFLAQMRSKGTKAHVLATIAEKGLPPTIAVAQGIAQKFIVNLVGL